MLRGDASIYVDQGGVEHVAIVTVAHTDGTVDLAVLKTSLRNVSRSSLPGPGKFFDPNWIDEAPPAPPTEAAAAPAGLSSVPLGDEQPEEIPVENPAHGAPVDVTPPEPQAG